MCGAAVHGLIQTIPSFRPVSADARKPGNSHLALPLTVEASTFRLGSASSTTSMRPFEVTSLLRPPGSMLPWNPILPLDVVTSNRPCPPSMDTRPFTVVSSAEPSSASTVMRPLLVCAFKSPLTRIHRRRASGQCPEAARGCSCESGIMVLKQQSRPQNKEHPIDAATQPSRSHPNRV